MLTRLLSYKTHIGPRAPGSSLSDYVAPSDSLFELLRRNSCPLRGTIHTRMLRRGQHLFQLGEDRPCIYWIYAGALKTYRLLHDSSESVTGFHFPGELVGIDALAGKPLRRGAVALNAATLFVLPIDVISDYIGRCAATRSDLFMRVHGEIVALEEHRSLAKLHAEQRVAAFVLWAVDKMSPQSIEPSLYIPMSQKDISNYLGMTEATLSRVLAHFEARQWLTRNGRELLVRSLAQLRNAAAARNAVCLQLNLDEDTPACREPNSERVDSPKVRNSR